jgi:hypothetical protein
MRFLSAILSLAIVLICAAPVLAGGVSISATDIEPMLFREDLSYGLANDNTKDFKGSYLSQYQIVYVTIENGMNKPVNVNPGYFTLASSARKSYSFSSEMFGLKNNLPWMKLHALKATKVLPGTSVEGFLMFDKGEKDEWPVSLYFESPETSGSIPVKLDSKAKYKK